MIKITTAFVATAALLMTATSAQLTCSLQTEEASITGVEIFSSSDFPNKYSHDDDYRFWADVKLTSTLTLTLIPRRNTVIAGGGARRSTI